MNKKGFTLIELLVTISIIAILSIIGLVLFQKALQNSRDSRRKSDLNKLSAALEIYYQQSSNNKYVVNLANTDMTSCPTDTSVSLFHTSIANTMSNQYVPTDPNSKVDYCYISSPINSVTGQSYTLCAYLENTSDPDISSSPTICATYKDYYDHNYNYGIVPK